MTQRLTENKIILIKRRTRLEDLIARYNTLGQAKYYIEHLGSDFSDYVSEDERYKRAVSESIASLESLARVQVVDREFVPNFLFGEQDVVVAIGQDGLVANSMKYLTTQLLVGVNPDPARWDGVLLPFRVTDLRAVMQDIFHQRRPIREVSMAKVTLNDGQALYGVNDLFIGQRTHVSSRYRLQLGTRQEQQSSSGIIVSTGLGSTGWLRSVIAGASGIVGELGGGRQKQQPDPKIPWNADFLLFSVREPFPSRTTKTELVYGKLTNASPLRILSQMPENGVIFSDGVESDFLHFNSGIEAVVTVAEKKGRLVV